MLVASALCLLSFINNNNNNTKQYNPVKTIWKNFICTRKAPSQYH